MRRKGHARPNGQRPDHERQSDVNAVRAVAASRLRKFWGSATRQTARANGVIALLTLLVTALGVYFAWLALKSSADDGEAPSGESLSGPAEPAPDSEPVAADNGGQADEVAKAEETSVGSPGACLADPADLDSVVACDTRHQAEVISMANGECDLSAAVQYAGGDPELDLLSDVVRVFPVDGKCVVALEGATAVASIEDSLGSDRGDGLRECYNGRSKGFVPCAGEHTGEVVQRVTAGSHGQMDCDAAAERYMGQGLSQRYSDLETDEVPTDEMRRCVVSLRSDSSWLETPLRNLGNAEIQTSPM